MELFVKIIIFGLVVWFLAKGLLPVKGVRQITSSELKQELKRSDVQLVDVRTPAEYRGGHIKNFINIPHTEMRERSKELSKEKEVILICQSGMRSNKAAKSLKTMGFTKITNVKGGLLGWKQE